MTPDAFADHYLRHTGLHAVVVLAAADGASFRIVAAPSAHLSPPKGITVAAGWWCKDEALARRVAEMAYEIVDASLTPRNRNWVQCPPAEAASLVAAAATRLGTWLSPDQVMRKRALAVVDEVERDMERRRRRGELKSVNRDYAKQRERAEAKGEHMPTYGDYMLGLKRRMLVEAARQYQTADCL